MERTNLDAGNQIDSATNEIGRDAGSLGASDGIGSGISPDQAKAFGAAEGKGDGLAKDAKGRDSGAPKKRGWPKGKPRHGKAQTETGRSEPGRSAGTVETPERVPLSDLQTSTLAEKIFSAHMLGAIVLKQPLVSLQPQEAETLAKAVQGLSVHFDFQWLFKAAGPYAAIASALFAVGAVYGPRVKQAVAERRAAKEARATAPASPFDIGDAPASGHYEFGAMN